MNAVLVALLLLPAAPPRPAEIDAAARAALKAWAVPGAAVVIVLDGKVHHVAGYGAREAGKEGAVTADTLFALGSCGKAFTTALIALLADEGKLTWDDRVRDHLPGFRLWDDLASRDVRLRDLACHRTGVASNDLLWFHAPWSGEEGVARLRHLPPSRPFRTAFQYNSVTFRAAGLAASRAAGEPWGDLVRERLLVPLGMKRTTLDATAAGEDADRARPHRLQAEVPVTFAPTHAMTPDPIGSLHASARDVGAWMLFHLGEGKSADGKRVASARSLRETHAPQVVVRQEPREAELFPDTTAMSYALGWMAFDHRGHKLLGHGGALDGQRAQILLAPRSKLGVAVLSNLSQTPMNLALSMTLLEAMLQAQSKRDWHALHRAVRKRRAEDAAKARREREALRRPDAFPSREATAYVGSYVHKAYGEVRVRFRGGRLEWEYRGERVALTHWHHDTFAVDGEMTGEAELTFQFGDEGVRGFRATGQFNGESFAKQR